MVLLNLGRRVQFLGLLSREPLLLSSTQFYAGNKPISVNLDTVSELALKVIVLILADATPFMTVISVQAAVQHLVWEVHLLNYSNVLRTLVRGKRNQYRVEKRDGDKINCL